MSMTADVGEYIVGAYLKLELGCDIVDYNVRSPGGGMVGLGEFDVVGYDMQSNRVYLCEVTTHIRGLLIGRSQAQTVAKIAAKHRRQRDYADKHLKQFEVHYQFWSPYVPKGYLTENLAKIKGLELVINGDYRECVEKLRKLARTATYDAVNPFFRMLQIMEAMKA